MSGHITILDYLNEHCWNLVLGYVPLQDIIRTERASQQWQQIVLIYLSNIHIGIDIKNLRGESIYRDVTSTFPHIRWMTLKENFSTHHRLQSVESSKFEKYWPSFERWICKLGASVVASYCFEWNFNILGRHCPNLEGVMMTDGVLNQFITSPVLEELLISGNERVTGQCLSNITSPNLKSLDLQCCTALACRLLPAASDLFPGLTSLILKGINCSYIESNFDKEDEPFDDILLVLEKTKKLERLCIREFVQYELRKYVDGFFEAVCGLSCLRELDVDAPGTDEAIEAVTRRCPELRILKFQNGSAVTGRGLAAVCAQAGARLAELRLPCNAHLTDDDVVACILACPNLEVLGLNASRRVTIALFPRAAAARRALHARRPLRLLIGRRGLIGCERVCPNLTKLQLPLANSSRSASSRTQMAERTRVWQLHERLEVVLELLFLWLGGRDLACCGAACRAWRSVVYGANAWRQLCEYASNDRAVRALADIYEGACPWRELYVSATAPWRRVARLAPERQTRLAAATLNRAGDTLAIAAEDCTFTIWFLDHEQWTQAGAGSVSLGWSGVARVEWAPNSPLLLLAGPAPLSAQRGGLAVLQPHKEGSLESWVVAARASGSGGCWAGEGFLSLELTRLTEPQHTPVFATDVWLNAATQETDDEFAGTAARVLRVYNESRAVITQILCADVPLDERAAQEWAESEATVRAEDACADTASKEVVALKELGPEEGYYRAIYDRGRTTCGSDAWVRLLVAASGDALGAWPLPRARPPALRVPAGALRLRVRARARRRQREAEAAAAGEVEEEVPEPSPTELRARCAPPAARLRVRGPVLGLTALQNGRAVWAAVRGGALCASLPALCVLRVVLAEPGAGVLHYLAPHTSGEYFGSPCGGSSPVAHVWGPVGRSQLSSDDGPALALLLHFRARPESLILTENAMHVWRCSAPRAPRPAAAAAASAGSATTSRQ